MNNTQKRREEERSVEKRGGLVGLDNNIINYRNCAFSLII